MIDISKHALRSLVHPSRPSCDWTCASMPIPGCPVMITVLKHTPEHITVTTPNSVPAPTWWHGVATVERGCRWQLHTSRLQPSPAMAGGSDKVLPFRGATGLEAHQAVGQEAWPTVKGMAFSPDALFAALSAALSPLCSTRGKRERGHFAGAVYGSCRPRLRQPCAPVPALWRQLGSLNGPVRLSSRL